MKRAEILDAAEEILKESSFAVSERVSSRPSCFDFVAKRKDHIVFIKAPANVGNISEKDASELHAISNLFCAKPLFISDGTAEKSLEDDTVYMRYNVWTITLKTLEDIVFRGMDPLVKAGPGGYYVDLNCEAIKEKRQCLGLSVGKLAEMGGTSRRTLYGYEKGMAKASVSVAYNLSRVLGVPLVQPLNMFQVEHENIEFASFQRHIISRHRFIHRILNSLSRFNLGTMIVRKAPFDFIAQSPEKKLNIIGALVHKKEHNVDQRAKEILSVSETIEAQTLFITEGKQTPNNGIHMIKQEDLGRMRNLEDIIKNSRRVSSVPL